MQKLYRPLVLLALLVLSILVLAGCRSDTPPSAQAQVQSINQPTPAPTPTSATTAKARPARAIGLSYTADIRARSQVNVTSKVSGRIEEIKVDVGDRVKAGDVVAVLEHKVMDAQVKQAEAALAAAQANLAKMENGPRPEQVAMALANLKAAEARLDLLKNTPFDDQVKTGEQGLERARNALWQAQSVRDVTCSNEHGTWTIGPTGKGMLVAPGGNCTAAEAGIGQAQAGVELAALQLEQLKAGPRAQDLAQVEAAAAAARESYRLAKAPFTEQDIAAVKAQVSAAEAALEMAKLNRDEAFIKAPVDGVIASRPAVVGGFASAAGPAAGTTIVIVVSQEVQVVFGVEESLYGRLKTGQPAILHVAAYPDLTLNGKVALISPVADPVARTFEVTIYPDDPEHKLRPGMFADVTLEQ